MLILSPVPPGRNERYMKRRQRLKGEIDGGEKANERRIRKLKRARVMGWEGKQKE